MDKKLENIINQTLDQVMSDRFGRYSKYIIQGRALPDARDGLKPVQRRILFSMNELGLQHNTPYKKSARVVGDVIGKYHPHGDSSIYEAMVRMAQEWKINAPLVDMHGNKGSIDDDPAAAMRYTEARLAKISTALLDNIKKNTVPFAPNFDDSEREPVVLPALLPNLLINGAKGIAAGYATEMPTHNLGEVVDAIVCRIKNPTCNLDKLLSFIQGPDFPTGGIVQGKDGIYQAFERGSGKILIRSKYVIGQNNQTPFINITEIPFGVIKQKLVRDIDEIRFNKKIDGIKDVRDESDRNGISIMIELQNGANVQAVVNYLLQKTDMQIYYSYNNIAIHNNAPKQMGLIDLIDVYLSHQKDVQTKAINFDLAKDKIRLEIVQGLIKVATIADEVIETIRNSDNSKQGVVRNLIDKYQFTELQANAIAELRLYRLSRADQSVYLNETLELSKRIARFEVLLSSPKEFDNYLISLLQTLKKEFAAPRKTVIEGEIEKIAINMETLIRHEKVVIGISRQGYIKRLTNRVYETNKLEEYALKPSDGIVFVKEQNTADKLLIFTNRGNFIFLPTHLIPECKWKDFGKHINDFASLENNELVIDAVAVNDFKLDAYLALVSAKGQIKRTRLADFEMSRYSKPSTAFSLKSDDELVAVRATNGLMNLLLFSSGGRVNKYVETVIPVYGTKSNGVIGMQLPKGDTITALVAANEDDTIGLISKRGGAKRFKNLIVSSSSRSSMGKLAYREIKNNPHIAFDARVISPQTQIAFTDQSEQITLFSFDLLVNSKTDEGFSLIGPKNCIEGRILESLRLYAGSRFFEVKKQISDEERFKRAEDKINTLEQISIDDLLKDLK